MKTTFLSERERTPSLLKTATALVLLAGALAMSMGSAFADYVPNTVISGNVPFPSPLNGSPSLAKCDDVGSLLSLGTVPCTWEDGASDGDYRSAFAVTATVLKDGEEPIEGTWTFAPGAVTGANPVLYPTKVAVKAGPNWFFYEVVAGTLTGTWSTSLLDNKEVSHISFYDTGVVPLPAAAWLFGSALLGIAGVGYRRQTKQS